MNQSDTIPGRSADLLADWPIAVGQRDAFLAWAAGFFDGEGCIRINIQRHPRMKAPSAALSMEVTNTVSEPLRLLNALYPGSFRTYRVKNRNWTDYAKWNVSGAIAYQFAKDILPFARVKQHQLRLGIAFWELPWRSPGRGHHRQRTAEQIAVDQGLARQISELKRTPRDAVAR